MKIETNDAIAPSSSPKREELRRWFRANAAPLADAYDGALLLLDRPAFPGRVHLLCHAVRDIANRLPQCLDPLVQGHRVAYENELDLIEKDWPSVRSTGVDSESVTSVSLSYATFSRLDALVTAHRNRRKRPQAELLFRHLMRHQPNMAARNERVIRQFRELTIWFEKRAHFRANVSSTGTESELKANFEAFESLLHSFVGNFFTGKRELDEILQRANG